MHGQAIVFDEVIFLITQKVASVSIQSALAIWQGYEPMDGPRIFHYIPLKDVPQYTQHKIAFVRDPWSRVLSFYRQKIEGKKGCNYELWGMHGNMPFSECVDCIESLWDTPNVHWAPCHLWADHADTVIRFETLNKGWEELRPKYGLPELPHHLSTGSSALVNTYYDKALREKVRSMYREDVDRWYSEW